MRPFAVRLALILWLPSLALATQNNKEYERHYSGGYHATLGLNWGHIDGIRVCEKNLEDAVHYVGKTLNYAWDSKAESWMPPAKR